jgi:hypothetical protein
LIKNRIETNAKNGETTMKPIAFILYTLTCLALGSLFFQSSSTAAGNFSQKYYDVYELGAPAGYKATFGISFKENVTRDDVIVDWKSNQNFVVYIK